MTKEDIINKYHDELTEEAISKVMDMVQDKSSDSDAYMVRYTSGNTEYSRPTDHKGILAGLEAHPV